MNNIYPTMGLISTVFFLLPVTYILFSSMIAHHKFQVVFLYYLLGALNNSFTLGYISAPKEFIYHFGITYNLLDLPLMLIFFGYLATTPRMKKVLRYLAIASIVAEIAILLIVGFTKDVITIVSGPGLLLVFILAIYFFLKHVQRAIRTVKANGKALICGAILVNYFVFFLVYLLYYAFKVHIENGLPNKLVLDNIFVLYYTGTILSTSIMCAGLVYESKRIRELFAAKTVRKELAEIYKHEKKGVKARPRAPFDDFDPAEFLKSNTYPQ